jgi:RNA polymerase sigma-70 factor (ECF subfamily)
VAQDNQLIRSLIESSRNGNNHAFGQLINMYVGYVFAISLRLLADIEDANENTSKIFIEARKTISMVRRDSPFILWLKAIAIYSSLQRIREKDKNKRDRNKQTPDRKGLNFLDQEIISLPETERIVFVLSDIEHYQIQEISDLLSVAKEEVENLLVDARKIIMKTLIIKSNEALERALKQIPESIKPFDNLYDRIMADISLKNIPDKKEESELLKDMDDESNDKQSKHEKKSFSFKDLFKKKE